MQLSELFVSFADFVLVLTFNDLNDVFSVWLLTILRFFYIVVAYGHMNALLICLG